jgi:hypothetical protein
MINHWLPRFLLFWLCLSASTLNALDISCPLITANRTLSDSLPAGWLVVPYSERVLATRVSTSGATQTLICDYGQAGLVQKNAPPDYVCAGRIGGFSCNLVVVSAGGTPTVRPSGPIIHRSGSVSVRARYEIDFDTGTVATGSPQSDLVFNYDPTHRWTLDTLSTTAYWRHNQPTRLGKSGCAAEVGVAGSRYLTDHYTVGPPEMGNSACVITNQGRLAEFTVTGFTATETGVPSIQFTFTTWPL